MRLLVQVRGLVRYLLLIVAVPLLSLCVVNAYSTHDFDNDGLSNSLEEKYSTDIRNPDTDRDGYMDGEEVFDIGTDPIQPTQDIFSELEQINNIHYKIFSISSGSTVVGMSTYIKGISDIRKDVIRLAFTGHADEREVSFEHTFDTDSRGVFSDAVSLDSVCQNLRAPNVKLTVKAETQVVVDNITVACFREDETSRAVSGVTLGGVSLDSGVYPIRLRSGENATLGLSLAPEYELKAGFASILFSSTFLADQDTTMVSFSPIRELVPGEHTVTYYIVDPEQHIVYPPVRIPFVVEDSQILSLKAELPLAQLIFLPFIALLVPLFAGLVRIMQRK